MPFIVELVKELCRKKIKIGLASSSSYRFVRSVLGSIGLEDHFKIIHTGESVKKGKPHPDIYLKTARMLNVKPENSIVIEDSRTGIEAAKKAGMKCIGFLNGRNRREDLEYSDFVINSFQALNVDIIKKIMKNGNGENILAQQK